ncbi:MAG: hypothetical protein AAF715_28670 [Myxococcota bacterium]
MDAVNGRARGRRVWFRRSSFITRDRAPEIWFAFVADRLEPSAPEPHRAVGDTAPPKRDHAVAGGIPSPGWLVRLARDFREQSRIAFDGLLEMRLDAHVRDDAEHRALVALLRAARADYATQAAALRRSGGDASSPAAVLRLADAMIWLLAEDRGSAAEANPRPQRFVIEQLAPSEGAIQFHADSSMRG